MSSTCLAIVLFVKRGKFSFWYFEVRVPLGWWNRDVLLVFVELDWAPWIFTARRYASVVYAVVVCQSVACPSVTSRHCTVQFICGSFESAWSTPISVNWTFFRQLSRLRRYERIFVEIGVFEKGVDHWAQISGKWRVTWPIFYYDAGNHEP